MENPCAAVPLDPRNIQIAPCPICGRMPEKVEDARFKPTICFDCDTNLDRKAASYGGSPAAIAYRYLYFKTLALDQTKPVFKNHLKF